jgi:hypothetical protein
MAVGDTITVNATPHVIALVSSSVLVNTVAAVTATSGVTVALGSTSPSSTRNVPVNSIVYPSQDANEGYRGGYDLAHNANSVTYSGSDGRGTYIAAAVLAQPAANAATIKPAIALIGDSIMNGTGWVKTIGPYRGFGAYALNELFPYVNVSCAGESAYQFADTTKSNTRVAYIQHCDYSVCEYGTNDLGRTESQIKAALVTIAQRAIIAGVKGHYQTTLIPRSASTDGHQTVASQTISTGADTMRQTINAWLRAPASAGSGNSFRYDVGSTFTTYVGIFDTAALVEYNADGSLIAIAADGTISNGVGGRWKAYGTTQYATKVGTTTGTTTTLTDSGATWTVNAWQGYMAAITTGGTTVYTQVISNTATVLTLNDTITAPTGSTTYFIYKGPTVDGIHPTDFIHKEMAAAINTGLFV